MLSLFDIEIVFQKLCTCRHILAAVHFNFNLQRDVKQREADGVERIKVSYPKFKNGEATVRDVRITQNFGKPLGLFMRVCRDHSPASLVLQKLLMVSYYVVVWLLFNVLSIFVFQHLKHHKTANILQATTLNAKTMKKNPFS